MKSVLQKEFSFIDALFAKRVLSKMGLEEESSALFLSALFALSRLGHLVLDLSSQGLELALSQLGLEGEKDFAARIKEGAEIFFLKQKEIAWVVRQGSLCYLPKNWAYETQILENLERLTEGTPRLQIPLCSLDPILNAEQQEAVAKALQHNVSFLTGGPGTGKTFTAAHIVKACLSNSALRIVLTAPTGKAAFRLASSLKELCSFAQVRSGTLHALLGIRSYRDEEVQPLFADLILVDESSMIDVRLFAKLLAAIPTGARVVFLGDKEQLPPVEAGSVFADLLETNRFPVTELQCCLRSDSNQILSLAQTIKEGLFPSFQADEWIDLEERSSSSVLEELWRRFGTHFLKLESASRFTILSCIRKGPFGVEAVNEYFLSQVLAQASSQVAIPVMVTANHYDLELYNGDLGVLYCSPSSNPQRKEFRKEDYVLFSNRKISPWALSSFSWGYCVSVHKSQGSEYDEVLILAPQGSEAFGREVLYTAVTRAKKRVYLASTRELVGLSIQTSSRKRSGLGQRLKD